MAPSRAPLLSNGFDVNALVTEALKHIHPLLRIEKLIRRKAGIERRLRSCGIVGKRIPSVRPRARVEGSLAPLRAFLAEQGMATPANKVCETLPESLSGASGQTALPKTASTSGL